MANVRSGTDRRGDERGDGRREGYFSDLFALCRRHTANGERIASLLSYPESLRPTAAQYAARDEAALLATENELLMMLIPGAK